MERGGGGRAFNHTERHREASQFIHRIQAYEMMDLSEPAAYTTGTALPAGSYQLPYTVPILTVYIDFRCVKLLIQKRFIELFNNKAPDLFIRIASVRRF